MIRCVFIIFFLFVNSAKSQSLNLNERHIIDYLRTNQISGNLDIDYSFTIRPFTLEYSIDKKYFDRDEYSPIISSFLNNFIDLRVLPIDYSIIYNSNHPHNRNDGSMIPSKGYQQLISLGIFLKAGPLSVQLKPENIYAENKDFHGFPDNHYDVTWARRYNYWNQIDQPERFGNTAFKKNYLGQSYIKLNYKKLSIGISSENIWWGPSIRNSIMMSNNAKGFNHITFNTNRPLKTKIGTFEWQFVTGRLESSGFTPPNIEKTYAGTLLYIPKTNQMPEENDWRFFQGYTLTYSPKWVKDLSIGFIRWVQLHGALYDDRYWWMNGKVNNFPVFSNLLRKNDKSFDIESQIDQAAGLFFRWIWRDSKAEIYGEFHYNDAKLNLRDLMLDSDHARAVTIGIQKLFKSGENSFYKFSWEWNQLQQTSSRILRDSGSWYTHINVREGYTNRGEVMGASIGPGSNAQYFSISKIKKTKKIEFAIEIIDVNNDWAIYAFEDSKDYRRYWKDFNFSFIYQNKFKNFWTSFSLIYGRSLNYQWELEQQGDEYYQNGKDVNNFNIGLKLTVPFTIK